MRNVKLYPLLFLVCSLLPLQLQGATDSIKPVTQDLPQIALPKAQQGQELVLLDQIIKATDQSLQKQKDLREMFKNYLKLKEQYARNVQDKEQSIKLVKQAHQLLNAIKEQHLSHLFDQETMSEITFFSNIASKWKSPT